MAEISSYPLKTPKPGDLLLGSRTYVAGVDECTGNPTSVFTVGAIADLVSAEAGGVNGTVGKIPVFTNTTTVGDSIMTQSSSKIGIGTNSPDYKLDVEGDISLVTGGENFAIMSPIVQGMQIAVGDPAAVATPLVTFYGANQSVGIGTNTP